MFQAFSCSGRAKWGRAREKQSDDSADEVPSTRPSSLSSFYQLLLFLSSVPTNWESGTGYTDMAALFVFNHVSFLFCSPYRWSLFAESSVQSWHFCDLDECSNINDTNYQNGQCNKLWLANCNHFIWGDCSYRCLMIIINFRMVLHRTTRFYTYIGEDYIALKHTIILCQSHNM